MSMLCRRTVGAIAVALTLPACASPTNEPRAGGTTTTVAPLAPCPADRGEVLHDAECGAVVVPENRASGQGRAIEIQFARFRAESPSAKGAVFLLAGGPGGASTSMAVEVGGWAHPLRATMDVVLVDQRGT